MKAIILISLLFAFSCAFGFFPKKAENLKDCSNVQINTAYAAIAACETHSVIESGNCILSTMGSKISQNWNVYSREQAGSADVAYWSLDGCEIKLLKYGKFERDYVLWSALAYNSSNLRNSISDLDFLSNTENLESVSACTSQLQAAAKKYISDCDSMPTNLATLCFKNKMKNNSNETWDIGIIDAENENKVSLNWWAVNGCSIKLYAYGSKRRNWFVWKAA